MLIREIERFVVSKACVWSAKRNYNNWEICRQWGMSERIWLFSVGYAPGSLVMLSLYIIKLLIYPTKKIL